MYEFLTATQNLPFAIALALLLVLLAIELAGFLFGADVSGMLGDGMPDAGVDVDLDLPSGDLPDVSFVTGFLYWLNVGRVPLIILLVLLMTFFVIIGYGLQYLLLSFLGFMMPSYVAAPAALLVALPVVRWSGKGVGRVVPRDETEAISVRELVGSRAVISLGIAKAGYPAQARVSDRFGTTHYVMAEPDDPEATLESGHPLLLVRYDGSKFFAIRHPEGDA